MSKRTRTYIAGDWTGDKELIDELYKWNDSCHWSLHFIDAHELTQSKDSSLACSIKKSLKSRLDISKTFVLIVGEQTDSLRKGSCQYCKNYDSTSKTCISGMHVDYRSFIEYECNKAQKDELKIVILYNFTSIKKEKCPSILRDIGLHITAYDIYDNKIYWNYQEIKEAITD